MSSGTHEVQVNLPIHTIWEFVKDMNKWAPLVPGYITHKILNEKQSTWTFNGDIGKLRKKISLQIDITKWEKPSLVTFHLKGLNEKFSGRGYFEAEAMSNFKTKVTGNLDIKAYGMMAPVVNPILKSFVPKTTTELTEAIAHKLTEVESAAY